MCSVQFQCCLQCGALYVLLFQLLHTLMYIVMKLKLLHHKKMCSMHRFRGALTPPTNQYHSHIILNTVLIVFVTKYPIRWVRFMFECNMFIYVLLRVCMCVYLNSHIKVSFSTLKYCTFKLWSCTMFMNTTYNI